MIFRYKNKSGSQDEVFFLFLKKHILRIKKNNMQGVQYGSVPAVGCLKKDIQAQDS